MGDRTSAVWCLRTIREWRLRAHAEKKCCAINVIVSGSAGFSPYSQGHDRSK
jgi:hypothetical protein